MSKTPAIDVKTMYDFVAQGHGAKARDSYASNPLADLVEEFDEFREIDVSPSFKSLKSTTEVEETVFDADVSESGLDTSPDIVESIDQPVEVNAVEPEGDDLHPIIMPTDLEQTPRNTAYRITTGAVKDQISIPSRRVGKTPEAAIIGATSSSKTILTRRFGSRGIMMAALALLAFSGAGYLYVQGTQTASSETVVYSVPVFDDDSADTTQTGQPIIVDEEIVDKPMEVAEYAPPPAMLPASVIPVAPQPLGFNDSLSNEFPEIEGQSLLDLATGVPTFTPSEIVPDSQWQEVSCGGCHSFDQADLCKQGAYYFNHDKARLNRIQHPYGGGYKTKLMEWAEGGCQ